MKRCFIVMIFLIVSVYCFSQQSIPGRIIGRIPDYNSTEPYQLKVGAFKSAQNAENAYYKLIIEGFNPVYEKYLDFTRVMITGISANQIPDFLKKVKQAGFNEVIIRKDITRNSISEKWEITTPGSAYSSFEFNQDFNYIAIKNAMAEPSENRVQFGEYTMPARDTINMNNLGILKIEAENDASVNLSFSPIDEPWAEINLSALKTERMPESAEIDLFCRTWKVVNCNNIDYIGEIIVFSNAGTYLFTKSNGESNILSQWRWYDDDNKEFEYSHDDWQHYGRVIIKELSINSLKFLDPGFYYFIPGYSSGDLNYNYECIPVK